MTIQKTEALVLKSAKFRDTSLITTFLTADFGKIKALSKGVRKERSLVLSHYEPFSHVQIVFYEKTKSDIHFLSECTLLYFFSKIRSDFEKISWASYLTEVAEAVLPVHEKNCVLFRLLLDVLHAMEKGPPSHLACIFEVKLLADSGVFPNLEGCMRCGKKDSEGYLSLREGGIFCATCRKHAGDAFYLSKGLIKTIRFFAENEFSRGRLLKAGKEMEDKLHHMTAWWIRHRFERELASVHFLREVGLMEWNRAEAWAKAVPM